jgi:hypothetical protein
MPRNRPTIPTTAELVAQQIIDFMGEYLEGSPLLVQENAVRHAVEQPKIFDKSQAAQEMAKALAPYAFDEYAIDLKEGEAAAIKAIKSWRAAGGQI